MNRKVLHALAALPVLLLAACGADPTMTPSAAPNTALATASPLGSEPAITASIRPSPTPTATPLPAAAGTYLALGDSLAVGVGAAIPSEGGYVARLAEALGSPQLANLAVSGATSASLRTGGQLAEAVNLIGSADPPVSLVTLDIGGNDLLGLLRSEPCANEPDGEACRRQLAIVLLEFEGSYRQTLAQLRANLDVASPRAELAVMTYFNPFSGTDAAYEAAGELALLGADLQLDCEAALQEANRGMNDIIACVAEEHRAEVADVKPQFDGLGLDLTHIGDQDIHANDRGYEVIAAALEEVLRGS